MPRLLLVDDNPSIHRIAESLLAPTDVALVCLDSAEAALDLIQRGERFDVALLDTVMPGMDGWTLLGRLRGMPETASMPMALMAGVLDPVDPIRLAKAPIQGFLKKPIELRELGDRVKALLATPVPVAPSPFSTMPAMPIQDLVSRAEAHLPEYRPEPEAQSIAGILPDLEPLPDEPAAPLETVPEPPDDFTGLLDVDLDLPGAEDDLLLLSPEDLWPEEPSALASPEPPPLPEVQLELEELDLDSLQDLTSETLGEVEPLPALPAAPLVSGEEAEAEEALVVLPELEGMEDLSADFSFASEPEPSMPTPALPVLEAALSDDWSFSDELSAGETDPGLGLVAAPPVPAPPPVPFDIPDLEKVPAATGQFTAAAGQEVPQEGEAPAAPDQARAVLQALLADPVLVDALVKAVVARMGDQVLREIAWEVMPDLAGRLQR